MTKIRDFSLSEAAGAAGTSNQSIKTWTQNGLTGGGKHNIEKSGGAGTRRNYSFENIMEFAIAKALLDVPGGRPSVPNAFKCAKIFAYTGHISGSSLNRRPSFPLSSETLLAASSEHCAIISNEDDTATYRSIREHLALSNDFIVINATEIFIRVCFSLGLDPYKLIKENKEH